VPFAPTTLSNKLRYPLPRCTWQELAQLFRHGDPLGTE